MFYFHYVLGLDTLTSGLLLSFYPAASAIIAPISGWLSDKFSYRPLTVIGMSLNTLILVLVSNFSSDTSFIKIAILISLLGIGSAFFQSPNNSSVMGSVPKEQLGIAGGVNALFRNLGMVTGTTISVLVFSFMSKLDINRFSNDRTLIDTRFFLKGFRMVIIFAAFSCFWGTIINLSRTAELILTKPGRTNE
jgi:MFS family permease